MRDRPGEAGRVIAPAEALTPTPLPAGSCPRRRGACAASAGGASHAGVGPDAVEGRTPDTVVLPFGAKTRAILAAGGFDSRTSNDDGFD